MARPRTFNAEEAIEQAMHVFWEHGYDGASLPHLLDGMGLTRGSLYKAFTDKRSLFLLVLQRYEQGAVDAAVAVLTDDAGDGLDRIKALFRNILQGIEHGDWRGCLLCSALAGPSARDPEIARTAHAMLDKMHGGFRAATDAVRAPVPLNAAQCEAIAQTLTTHYIGLRILTRSRPPLATLDHSVASLFAWLDMTVGRPGPR